MVDVWGVVAVAGCVVVGVPSPTLSPTDPVPRGLLTLCPWASSGPQSTEPIYAVYRPWAYIRCILRAGACVCAASGACVRQGVGTT